MAARFGRGGTETMETLCERDRGEYVKWAVIRGLYDCKNIGGTFIQEMRRLQPQSLKGGEGGQWKHYMRGAGKCVSGDREGYVSDRRTL